MIDAAFLNVYTYVYRLYRTIVLCDLYDFIDVHIVNRSMV